MSQEHNHLLVPERFKESFEAIAPLIIAEWPQVSAEQLATTQGDLNLVVKCIATETEHTQALIRRQLQELYQIAVDEKPKLKPSSFTEQLKKLANEQLTDSNLKEALLHLESQTEKLMQQLKEEVLPEVNEKVQRHPMKSLLTAGAVGFVLGLLLGGRRGR